jgi:nucleoside 2-deoxyribosyltransferase
MNQKISKVIYVAGPFRGPNHFVIAENIRNAERLALEVWKLGAAALCPHANTAHFQDAAPDWVWLDGDLEMLRRCDGILVTPDWQRSAGAREEVAYATQRGIPVFLTLEDLAFWLNAGERSLQVESEGERIAS